MLFIIPFLFPSPGLGTSLHEWTFEERARMNLPHTDNSRQPMVNWTVSYGNSKTTGEGTFRIQRNGGAQNTRFDVGETGGAEYVYLVAEIAGWDFSHTAGANPLMRFSFMNGPASATPSEITAEVVIAATNAGNVTLQARAQGTGGTSSSALNRFTVVQTEPVTLVLAYSESLNRYQVHYRAGAGVWTLFYSGMTSGARAGPSARMQVSGDFDGAGANFLDLERVALETESPVGGDPAMVVLNTLREEGGTTWELDEISLSIGSDAGQTGELRIRQGGKVTGARTIDVGNRGEGTIELTAGGTLAARSIFAGSGNGAVARVEVSGAGSRIETEAGFRIGADRVSAPAGADATVRVRQEGVIAVSGRVAIREGGSLAIESGGSLIAERGLDMGRPGEGGFLEIDGGTLVAGGPLDLGGANGFSWIEGPIVAESLVTGLNRITDNNTLWLNGWDAFVANDSAEPLTLGSGASIEGVGTVSRAVDLGVDGTGMMRGVGESTHVTASGPPLSRGGFLSVVGEVTGLGTLERVRVNGAIVPAGGAGGIVLQEVAFADGAGIRMEIAEGDSHPKIFFDEATDFSNARLVVRFSGAPPAASEQFEILEYLGEGWPRSFFQGVSLPAGWDLEEGTLVYSGAPPVATYEEWAVAHGLAGEAALPEADPDGDGRDNRAEFFFGGDPMTGSGSFFETGRDGGAAFLRWPQRQAGDVVYELERSEDLVTWGPASEAAGWRSAPSLNGYRWAEVAIPEGEERGFFRVRAAEAPALPVFPGETWETIEDPEAEGVPAATIAQCIQMLNNMDTTGFMAIKGGRVLFDYGDLAFVSYSASVRKSILSMLYGKYVDMGVIDIWENLQEIGIDDQLGLLPIERAARVHDLLRARSGVYHPRSNTGDNWDVAPPRGSQIPGTYYLYNNWDFNALGTIFMVKTGKTPYEALESDFARPLQMEDFSLDAQSWGGNQSLSRHLAYYFHLSTRDMARLGYLMLRGGEWAGERIISESWMEQSLYPWTPSQQMNPASRRSNGLSYSYLWWLREVDEESPYFGSYAAHGAGGQYIMIIPKLDLVLAHKTNSSGTSLSVSRTQFYNLADVLVEGMVQ